MHSFQYQDGHLFCEEIDLETLADTHGTPLYVYSSATILDHYRRLDADMVKANSNLAVRHLLAQEDCGLESSCPGRHLGQPQR